MKFVSGFVLLVATFALQGCGNLNSIHRSLPAGGGALIDIKQRAIIAGRVADSGGGVPVVCSEPSPDAMAAYALEVAAKVDKAPADLAMSSREALAYVGLRTSSIQLLRDQLFQNCLSYLNGAIDKSQFDLMARRYQKQAVAMLAIEQLTGALRTDSVVLTNSGASQAGGVASTEASKAAADVENEIVDLTAKAAAETDASKKAGLEAKIKLATERRDILLKNVGSKVATSGSSAGSVTKDEKKAASAAEEVVQAVEAIALSFMTTDDTPQLCLSRLSSDKDLDTKFGNICSDLFKANAKALDLEIELTRKKADLILSSASLSSAQKKQELDKLSPPSSRFQALSQPFNIEKLLDKGLFEPANK